MRKLPWNHILPILFFLFSFSDGHSQWKSIYEQDSTTSLFDLSFVTDSLGWVVGDSGTVLKTEDGGKSFTKQATGTDRKLYGVDFQDPSKGWIVGEQIILRTTDGGASWQKRTDSSLFLNEVQFVDSSYGWALGHDTLIHTTDGGSTWNRQGNLQSDLQDLSFLDRTNGYCLSFDSIYHTADGGTSWTSSKLPSSDLRGCHFVSVDNGWVVGGDQMPVYTRKIHRTRDGTASWDTQSDTAGNWLISLDFLDSSRGWVCGNGGSILHTESGGASWGKQVTETDERLYEIEATSPDIAYAVGSNGTVLRTENVGDPTELKSTNDRESDPTELYPNPVRDRLKIHLPASNGSCVKLRIHDAQGRLERAWEKECGSELSIDVNELSVGSYTLSIRTEDRVIQKRFVKE